MKTTCPNSSLFALLCLNLGAFSAATRYYGGVRNSSFTKPALSALSFSPSAASSSTASADALSPTSLPPLRFPWSSDRSEENTQQTLQSDSSLLDRNRLPTDSATSPRPSRSPVPPTPRILESTLKLSPTALLPPSSLVSALTRRAVQSSSIAPPDPIPASSGPSLTSPSSLPPPSDSPVSASYPLTLTLLAFALPAFLFPFSLLLLISLLRTRRREAALSRKLDSLHRAQYRLQVARGKRERNSERRREAEGEHRGVEDADRERCAQGRTAHASGAGLCEMQSPVEDGETEEGEARWRKQLELQGGEWVVEMG